MPKVSRQQYWQIKNALTKEEKNFIDYYVLEFVMRQNVPTIEQVANYLKISHTKANYYLSKKNIQKALDNRGIPWKQHSQEDLTPTQVAVAQVMMNFADTRSNEQKLDELGVSPVQYQAWLKDPVFKNLVESLSEQALGNIKPTAIGEYTKKIYAGDWQALKHYLDTVGAADTTAPSTELILRAIVEIVQEEVKDPEVMLRIANRFRQAMNVRTIEAVAVEDTELESARRQLGV